MTWEKVKLESITSSITDGDHQSIPLADTGIPFIVISDIRNNRVSFEDARYVPWEYYNSVDEKRRPKRGDVLLTVKGSFGIPAYVTEDRPFVFQRDVAIFKCNNRVNSRYLFYAFLNPSFYAYADLVAIGSAQRALTLTTLRNTEIPLPPIEIQNKIVRNLEPFDQLIENHQKQISYLEEAAQRLYKEWFVDLRFPGYEEVQVTDGIPKGWHLGTLLEVAEFRRGKTITKKQAVNGEVPVIAGGKEPAYFHNKSNTEAPVITVSASGNAGFTKMYYRKVWASDCSFLDDGRSDNLLYVYLFLKDKQDDIYAMQKGSCQQHVSAKDINAMEMIVPPDETLLTFKNVVSPYFAKIAFLEQQISLSLEARDRLLSKLMSGEIEL